jgi:N-acetylmuramoyl-L-alanine amidase
MVTDLDRRSEDYQTLLKTVWAEARGEPVDGQKAVAWVVKNRVSKNKSHWGGNTIRGVCRQQYQFSCWNGVNNIDMSRDTGARDAIDSWLPAIFSSRDPTNGSTHYYAYRGANRVQQPPSWASSRNCVQTVDIGNHRFYRCTA